MALLATLYNSSCSLPVFLISDFYLHKILLVIKWNFLIYFCGNQEKNFRTSDSGNYLQLSKQQLLGRNARSNSDKAVTHITDVALTAVQNHDGSKLHTLCQKTQNITPYPHGRVSNE